MHNELEMNINPLVKFIGKETKDFTKDDIIKYIENNQIEMVNFRYVAGDGRLKTLNFVAHNKNYLDSILSTGERVDGSSLFKNIETGASDLYVIPRFSSAFINPFTQIPTIDFLCSYFTKDGLPMASSPEFTMQKAHKSLKQLTGFDFEVMGELEYYVISEKENIYNATDQKGYHESQPYTKWENIRTEAMYILARMGASIKYGHSEVGSFSIGDMYYEQNEIEFLPTDLQSAADQIILAKWVLRMLGNQYGVTVSFSPKITTGKAGSGMHIHTRLMKDGKNIMVENGIINDNAKKAIAGYLTLAPSLTAFGNTIPTSYMRLVPHQEAPTNICWGDRNRSVLVRVPLGWNSKNDMVKQVNPKEESEQRDFTGKQTVEFRCPDGSADIYLLIAGLTVAVRHGFEMQNALEYAKNTYVGVNIFSDEHKDIVSKLSHLPSSCHDSALQLEKQADIYKKDNVFTDAIINGIINNLKSYNDTCLRQELECNPEQVVKIVEKYIHCA